MSGRVILVTGANGAIGAATAAGFLGEDASHRVWLGVRRGRERADDLVARHPGRCHAVELEVTSPPAWRAAVDRIVAVEGRLEVLVNNAGGPHDALLANLPAGVWEETLATNLDAVFYGCQAVLPTMIGQRWGRIVNIASLSALLPPAGQANYAAAKAGVVALTQSLAKEVARIQITVNAVCPGYIETEATAALPPEAREAARARIPMRRFGRPEEVAAVVQFLACPAASYITGSTVRIDGGIL